MVGRSAYSSGNNHTLDFDYCGTNLRPSGGIGALPSWALVAGWVAADPARVHSGVIKR
jgi:hypothetical protein